MTDTKLLDATCRVALAALLHDLGKFAERARIPEADEKDAEGNTRKDINVQLYCPEYHGRRTHIHAAYSAMALDLLERHFPELVGGDMAPFAPWLEKGADDSLINAAAMHHRPDTFLQWLIATADRVAAGFEREEFEKYNASTDETPSRKDHYTARLWTLFEQIRLDGSKQEEAPAWRYPLKALSPEGMFPVMANECERADRSTAQGEYRTLWVQFLDGLKDIPPSHRFNLALWLDHFESLWLCFTHAIPAATAFSVKPEVSLYDHSKAAAALAAALWRYHHERGDDPEKVRRAMKQRTDWNEPKLLLVQGDFSGIQDFIFAAGGGTQRRATKLLRGRSFYVSLLTECAALKILDALSLPSTSQVINAAGKFLIVGPNTDAARNALTQVQLELNSWFLSQTYGQSGIGLASLSVCCDDFKHGEGDASPFRHLMKRLFEKLEEAKLQRLGICGDAPPPPMFGGFLDAFDNTKGACAIDGRSPAMRSLEGEKGIYVSDLAYDQVMTGKWLATQNRVLITRAPIDPRDNGPTLNQLICPVFGYHVLFTKGEEETGKFGREAESGNLLRAWDFSLPEDADKPLWNGYARRYINAHVPCFGEMNAWDADRYKGIENPEDYDRHPEEIKTFNHLARDDRRLAESDRWIGVEALMTMKGDVDSLGLIFQRGLERPTFAKMAALSRQMNAFFAMYLPWLCRQEFPNTYTVFAGGDDFFLIGPWYSTMRLVLCMNHKFTRFVATNPKIHFSAGLSMTKPGLPIRVLGELAEQSLDTAKSHGAKPGEPAPKNAVTCFDHAVTWAQFGELMDRASNLGLMVGEHALSIGYLYDLLRYTDMAGEVPRRPEAALWHSHFAYRTRRLVETRFKEVEDRDQREAQRRRLQGELAKAIADDGIEKHEAAYKIALFTYLYQQRD